MKSLILAAGLIAATYGHNHMGPIAVAMINPAQSQGATGFVTVQSGIISVSLDLTNFNFSATAVNASTCRAGINYHIHVGAVGGTAVGAGCGASIAGGHFDPTFACGGATDKKECANKGGCIQRTYVCNTAAFMANPLLGCEVGDWSGKYGKLMPLNSSTDVYASLSTSAMSTPSPFEISSSELYQPGSIKSVVFHCGSPRILCADFAPSTTNATVAAPLSGLTTATAAGLRLVADFGSIGGPLIEFGGQQMSMTGSGLSALMGCSASTMSMTIGNTAWGASATGVKSGTACNASLPVNDPTVGCVPGSANGYCGGTGANTYRCNASYPMNYTAATMMSAYYVSQGAMFTAMPVLNTTVDMRLLDMSVTALLNKPVVLKCGTSMWCAKIIAGPVGYVPDTRNVTTPSVNMTGTSGAPRMTIGVAIGVSAAMAAIRLF